jgi:hypothetical protein
VIPITGIQQSCVPPCCLHRPVYRMAIEVEEENGENCSNA